MQSEQRYEEYEIDLLELLLVLRRNIVAIVICAMLGTVLAGVHAFFIATPLYSSTSQVYILTQSTSITSFADIQVGTSLAADYVELIKSRPVVEKVIDDMKMDITYEQMLQKMSVVNKDNTRILKITVTDPDPKLAMKITNDFAKVAKKQISEIMKTDEPNIVEKGIVDNKPVSPNKKKELAMGFMLGLILACAVVTVRYLLDDTIKNDEDVRKYLQMDTIGTIPYIGDTDKEKTRVHRGRRFLKRKHRRRESGK